MYEDMILRSEHKRVLQSAQERFDEKIAAVKNTYMWKGMAVVVAIWSPVWALTVFFAFMLGRHW